MAREKKADKEKRFVEEFIIDMNATDAAARAGYEGTRAHLSTTGYNLTRKPEIAKAIREAMDKRAERVELHQDEVLQHLIDHLRVDMGDAFGADGKLLTWADMPQHVRRAIQSVEVEELFEFEDGKKAQIGWVKKVKFWSKDKALELAMRHRGLLNDKLKVEGTSLEELVKAARGEPTEG